MCVDFIEWCFWETNLNIFLAQATDLSEASQEAVEEKLRATDRQ
jgi:hypothetical protein